MKHFSLYVALMFCCSQAFAGQTYYQDIPKGQSPFNGSAPATPDAGNARQQADLYNSGLYKDAPNVKVPSSSSSAGSTSSVGNTSSSVGGQSGSKTFYDSQGFEVDSETGILTGNRDSSKATSSSSTTTKSADSGSSSSGGDAASVRDPAENTPTGYLESAARATAIVAGIRTLVAQAGAQNAVFNPVGLPEIETGEKAYTSGQKACTANQASASTWCRDETNPGMQSTMMMINAAATAANTLAVNDSCSNFSKMISLAQAGMTAYTVSCGAMKFKCDTSCGATVKGLTAMKAGLAKQYACIPAVLTLPNGCPAIIAQFEKYRAELTAIVEKEMIPTDRLAVAGKASLCKVAYAGLLASAGLSLVSLAKSLKDGKKCDEESDASAASSIAAEASPTPTSSPAPTTDTGNEIAGSGTTTTVGTTPPATSTQPVVGFPTDGVNSSGTVSPDPSSIRKMSESPYAAYLPGGSKDPSREVASEASWKKEVTSAGGKSNWLKTKERFREFEAIP